MHEWSIIMKSKTTDHDLNIRDTYSLIIHKYKFCQKGLSLTHVLSYGCVCVCALTNFGRRGHIKYGCIE